MLSLSGDNITFSIAVALMTRGPLTAYSIFLMQGFMLSMVTVAAEDMLEVLGRFFRETKSLCLKLMMLHNFWRPVWEQGRSGNCMKEN